MLEAVLKGKYKPASIEDMWIVTVMSDDRQELASLAAKKAALDIQETLKLVKSGVQPEGPIVPCPRSNNKNRKFMRKFRLTGGVPGMMGIDLYL
jgi:hypothetical protein